MNKITEFVTIVIIMVGIIAGAVEFGQMESLNSIANLVNIFAGVQMFLGAFVVASLFTAYLVVVAPIKFFIRLLAIPAWLIFSLSLLITVDQFMGYSYPAIPPQSEVISFYVYKDENNNRMIESWMYLRDEGRARAYNFPHTPQREQALQLGKKAAGKGEPVEVDLRKGSGEEDGQEPESMIIYNWDLNATHPSKQQNIEDVPTEMPVLPDDGNTYKISPDGEIELIDPKKRPAANIQDWDDLSNTGTQAYDGTDEWGIEDREESYYGYGWDSNGE